MTLPEPLAPFAAYRQFMLYKLVPKENGKTDKLPVNPYTMEVASAHDPATWIDAETAVTLAGGEYGIAFVFTEHDPFFFIDIDNCVENGQWSPVAQDMMNRLQGAAIEVSQSGTGLHIFGTYEGEAPVHGCKNQAYGLEMYHTGRFVALTGYQAVGSAATNCNGTLTDTINTYFPAATDSTPEDWRDGPVPEWSGPTDDDVLINKMLSSKGGAAMFGNKATFKDLWTNNEAALALAYPSLNAVDPYDRSSADAALAQHLAFWTGKDHERINRLMWKSALVREKWTGHKKYLKEMTITRAVSKQKDVYSNGQSSKPIEPDNGQYTTGDQFLTPTTILEYFKGCIYIQDQHRIYTPAGSLLKPDQFKATYGGYEFTITHDGKTTRNAWEAFVENQTVRNPKVSSTCFRPEIEPGLVIEENGKTMVNIYTPIITPRMKGDVTPFVKHMEKLFPDNRDREIIMCYLAAVVQYPGVKFQWAPLIQGGEGNGKSLIARVMEFAVGSHYTHIPTAQDLGNQFNGWILYKLLIIVEEIFISHKRELMERLKTPVTNERIEVQQKGVDQFTADNRSNWIAFTNHKDAIIISIDGRRWAVFYTPQQTASDLVKWGMDGDYFPKLYNWLKNQNGYEYVNEYLHTYPIKNEFNPATECQRAPMTTSTREAVDLSIGNIEQEIMEAISQERPGFSGGWISSTAVNKLLCDLHADRLIPLNKRRMLIQSLGYDWHPTLPDGRVNNVIIAEGNKPRLFIKNDHPYTYLQTTADVVKQYVKDQGYPEI